MDEPKDQDIEERAIGLAQDDKLEWVKRPQQKGQPDTPAGATNVERDHYRDDAREQIREEQQTIKGGGSSG